MKNKVIFKKNYSLARNPLEYLLAYSSLDTEESITMEGFCAEQAVLCCGHKIILVRKIEEKVSSKLFEKINGEFKKEILNPFVDCEEQLSERFSKAMEEALSM